MSEVRSGLEGVEPVLLRPHGGLATHILEQKRERRLIRPSAKYVGPASRPLPRNGRGPGA